MPARSRLKKGLSLADVYAVLAYYYDHQAEIDRTMSVDELFALELRGRTPTKLEVKRGA